MFGKKPKRETKTRDIDVARALVPYIWAIVQFREGKHKPPFEVQATGANGLVVAHFRMSADGNMETVDLGDAPVTACFPITVTVTDQCGEEWNTTVEEEAIQ